MSSDKPTKSTEREMSFVEHLEELRQHIIRSLIAIMVAAVAIFYATDFVFNQVIFAPIRPEFATYRFLCWFSETVGMGSAMCYNPSNIKIITLTMGEPFTLHLTICFFGGLIVAFPYILWEVWRFISPGLYIKERRAAQNLVGVGSFLFLTGVAFGYFIIAPFGINFLVNYTLPLVNTGGSQVQANSYINYMLMFTIPTGLVFELPIIVYYMARVGLLTPQIMREYRRHAIVIILIIAALITPPDVVTQIFVTIPVYVLYELSIGIAARQAKLLAIRDAADAEN